jgi:hypothetical protein
VLCKVLQKHFTHIVEPAGGPESRALSPQATEDTRLLMLLQKTELLRHWTSHPGGPFPTESEVRTGLADVADLLELLALPVDEAHQLLASLDSEEPLPVPACIGLQTCMMCALNDVEAAVNELLRAAMPPGSFEAAMEMPELGKQLQKPDVSKAVKKHMKLNTLNQGPMKALVKLRNRLEHEGASEELAETFLAEIRKLLQFWGFDNPCRPCTEQLLDEARLRWLLEQLRLDVDAVVTVELEVAAVPVPVALPDARPGLRVALKSDSKFCGRDKDMEELVVDVLQVPLDIHAWSHANNRTHAAVFAYSRTRHTHSPGAASCCGARLASASRPWRRS